MMIFTTLTSSILSTSNQLRSIEAICNGNVNQDMLKDAMTTEQLAELAYDLICQAKLNLAIMNETVEEIEQCQNQNRASDKLVIELQNKLIASNNSQQEKLTDQIKKFSDVVTSVSSVPSQITKSVEKTILSTVKNTEKEKNVIVFGLKESPEKDLYGLVGDLLLTINVKPKFEAERIGRGNERPIELVLENKRRVFDVLSAAKKLKSIEKY